MFTRKLLFIFIFIATATFAQAQEVHLEKGTKELCNEIMLEIYKDILIEKDNYKELSDFDEYSLMKNEHDIFSIIYKKPQDINNPESKNYEFGITIIGIKDSSIYDKGHMYFNYSFPMLGLKFTGYHIKNLLDSQFNVHKYIEKYGIKLWDQQQEFMPYKLTIKSEKDVYKVGEDIAFVVTLTNHTKKNLWFKDLNSQTVFFLYDGKPWGAELYNKSLASSVKKTVVKSKKSISKKFVGDGFKEPKEVEIFSKYGMTYKGMNPSDRLKLSIVE